MTCSSQQPAAACGILKLYTGSALRLRRMRPTSPVAHHLSCRLRGKGFSAFIAGGWVRDVYLQRRAADIDIATSASPPRVRSIFSGDRMVDLPRSTVKLTHQGEVRQDRPAKGVDVCSSSRRFGHWSVPCVGTEEGVWCMTGGRVLHRC
jgi:hypothetical protein